MSISSVLHVLGRLCLVFAGLLLLPLVVAAIDGELWGPQALAFVQSAGVAVAAGGLLLLGFRKHLEEFDFEEGFAVVTLGWVAFAVLGALPYWLTDALPDVADACFESLSGLSTTGASVVAAPEALGRPLLFWRALTHWVGGMGVVMLSVAILPALGAGGNFLFQAETAAANGDKLLPKIRDVAKLLWGVYVGLTVLEIGALCWAGMSPFDSVCHAFATMATGGFGTHSDSLASFGPSVQWVVTFFMVLAGLNYVLVWRALLGRPTDLLRSTEARLWVGILVLATLVCTVVLRQGPEAGEPLEQTVRGAAFSVVSVCTTTGFATDDFGGWPAPLQIILVLLMLIGACAGTTSGSAKVSRHMIWAKSTWRELRRMLRPTAVMVVKVEGKPIAEPVVARSVAYLLCYLGAACAGTLALALLGLGALESLTGMITCLSGVGPGLGELGPTHNFAAVPDAGKWILMGAMLLGRLEFFAVFALFSPLAWRR